jgi:CDP-6-deoxy-D-xylo-4-hexulose-3-dehydrase
MSDKDKILDEILHLVERYYETAYKAIESKKDIVSYSGAVFDAEELKSVVEALLNGRLAHGKYTLMFENNFARAIGAKHAIFVNSGSSANLLAIATLSSEQLDDSLKLRPGDEVITPALTFPTTLSPLLIYGLKPVFIDVELSTLNIDLSMLDKAVSERTKAIFVPHTLGNPVDMEFLREFADSHDLLLIEDSCDALGSKFNGKYVGTFGHFGTFSFYPAHQITTGEGGMLVTNDDRLAKTAKSIRDWGRACIMPSCNPLTCGDKECPKSHSFSGKKIYDLPDDYDKRYTYINIGLNVQATELQAAFGLKQLEKLSAFCNTRRRNFKLLMDELEKFDKYFILPTAHPKSEPCWFAFPITLKPNIPFRRSDLLKWLVKNKIDYRLPFAGNILKQPGYKKISYRVVGDLKNTDYAMYNTFFVGVYPGLKEEDIAYVADTIRKFITNNG